VGEFNPMHPHASLAGSGVLVTRRAPLPSAAITQIDARLPSSRVLKTISFPSADQDGRPFNPVGVSARRPPPSALIV